MRWILLLKEFEIENKDKIGVENKVTYHLSRIRIEDDVPIDDFLPTENVYQTDSFVGKICLTSEEPSIDADDAMSIDTTDDQNQEISPITITFNIKISIACNKLHPDHDPLVDGSLSREVHAVKKGSRNRLWYADIVNYLVVDVEPEELRGYTGRSFLEKFGAINRVNHISTNIALTGYIAAVSPKLKSLIFYSNAMDPIMLDILQPLKRYQIFFRQDSGGQPCFAMLMHS